MDEIHEDWEAILYGVTDPAMTEAYENLPDAQLTLVNELWEDLKIESTIGGTIIGLAVGIVVCLSAMGIFFAVRRRKRRRIVADLWSD